MPRPKKALSPEVLTAPDPRIDAAALVEAGKALDIHDQQLALVDQRYSVGMPFDFERMVMRLQDVCAMEAVSAVEAGMLLIQIKEHTPGRFAEALRRLDLSPRWAQKRMQVAIRLRDRPRLQRLGVSKALELLGEDDGMLDALELDALADLSADELDAMTARELRDALRKERLEAEEAKAADEEIIRRKDDRINAMQRDKRKRAGEQEVRDKAADLLRDADEAVVEATSQIAKLRGFYADITQLYSDAGLDVDADIAERLEANAKWASDQVQDLADLMGE
jgi:hypothetical protein